MTLDTILTHASKTLRLCGNGKPMNWSVRVADALFVDCACCLVWRGVAAGITIGISFCALAAIALTYSPSLVVGLVAGLAIGLASNGLSQTNLSGAQ
jgi:hypothetical protein